MQLALNSTPTLAEVAARIGGQLHGDPQRRAEGLCPLDEPKPAHISFSRASNAKRLLEELPSVELAALLVHPEAVHKEVTEKISIIVVADPQRALLDLVPLFFASIRPPAEISLKADIHPTARIGQRVAIGAFAVVGAEAEVGDDAIIHPHVTIYPRAVIGARSVLHSGAVIREHCTLGCDTVVQNGAVIGADGFGYIPDPELGLRPVPQVGTVLLGERVEIGANSCIDRAAMGTTGIGLGTKIDNLVQIGHNCKIGRFSILCGQAALAGSSELGAQVVIGGNAGVADHIKIADRVRVAAKAGVTHDLREAGDYGGYPAVPVKQWRRQCAALNRLPEFIERVRRRLKVGE